MDSDTQQILNRWKSIQGHAAAVETMIVNDAYCVDILKQTLAIQGAIEKANALILERHLHSCVTTAIQSNDASERERVIRELMEVFKGSGHLRRVAAGSEAFGNVAAAMAATEASDSHPAHEHGASVS